MIPQRFPGQNIEFTKPKGWTDEECFSIHGFKGNYANERRTAVIITAWKPTPEELVKLNLGEPLWLTICSEVMPPVLLTTERPWPEPDADTSNAEGK